MEKAHNSTGGGLLYLDMGRRDEARKAFAAAEKALLKLGSVPLSAQRVGHEQRPPEFFPAKRRDTLLDLARHQIVG